MILKPKFKYFFLTFRFQLAIIAIFTLVMVFLGFNFILIKIFLFLLLIDLTLTTILFIQYSQYLFEKIEITDKNILVYKKGKAEIFNIDDIECIYHIYSKSTRSNAIQHFSCESFKRIVFAFKNKKKLCITCFMEFDLYRVLSRFKGKEVIWRPLLLPNLA